MGQREQRFLKEIKEEENNFLQAITPKEEEVKIEKQIDPRMEKYFEAFNKALEEQAIRRFKEDYFLSDDFDMEDFRKTYKKTYGKDPLEEKYNLECYKKRYKSKFLKPEVKEADKKIQQEKEADKSAFIIVIILTAVVLFGIIMAATV